MHYDPLRAGAETAEVANHRRSRSHSPSRGVKFSPSVAAEKDREDSQSVLTTSQRADSVASCASEWVNQKDPHASLPSSATAASVLDDPAVPW
jgi:hypothetical protein